MTKLQYLTLLEEALAAIAHDPSLTIDQASTLAVTALRWRGNKWRTQDRVPVVTRLANGVSYGAFIAAGWNDTQLRERGFIL